MQRFYDWYVPRALQPNKYSTYFPLEGRTFVLSDELRQRIKEDEKASSENQNEIVGLDFDPFLNTQDLVHRYLVKAVIVRDGECRADVHGVYMGKTLKKPDVVPQLRSKGGRWIFVNFLYPQKDKPEDAELLSVLKTLRDARNSHR